MSSFRFVVVRTQKSERLFNYVVYQRIHPQLLPDEFGAALTPIEVLDWVSEHDAVHVRGSVGITTSQG